MLPQQGGDGQGTKAELRLESSLALLAMHTQPCAQSGAPWLGLQARPVCQGLSKTAPATQGAGETGTSPGQPPPAFPSMVGKNTAIFQLLTSAVCPSCLDAETPQLYAGPAEPSVLGASLWGPPPPVQTLTRWRQEWGWLSAISSWRADPSHLDCLLAPYHGQHALPHQAQTSPQTQALPLSP